jgi:hypothetical protein
LFLFLVKRDTSLKSQEGQVTIEEAQAQTSATYSSIKPAHSPMVVYPQYIFNSKKSQQLGDTVALT